MRKLILIALLIFSVMISAQTHLRFEGIEITGHVQQFGQQLEKLGYRPMKTVGDYDTFFEYKGIYHGDDVILGLMTTPKSQILYHVAVFWYPENKNELYRKYNSLYAQMVAEYGDPIEVKSEFNRIFRADGGVISLTIYSFPEEDYITAVYGDSQGLLVSKEEGL